MLLVENSRLDSTISFNRSVGSTKEANSEASHVLPPRRQNTSLARFLNTGVRQQRTVREEPPEVSKVRQGNGLSDKFNDVAIHQATESCIQISEFNTLQSDPSLPTPLQTGTSVSPHIVVTAPVTSTPNNSPPYENLVEIVASKQKAPYYWQNSAPNSADNSPITSAKPIRRSRSATPSNKSRSRSPLLGISALGVKKGSQISLDWDNFSSDPTYFKIPIVNTPSPSLIGSTESFDQLFTPTSVIMAVKRCTKCHRYIAGAPDPSLTHSGPFGNDCLSEHHPDPCLYINKDGVSCNHYQGRSGNNKSLNESQIDERLIQENQQLLLSSKRVETLMRMFPVNLMTMDRLKTYESELEKIRDKYMEFSDKVVLFSSNYPTNSNFVKSAEGIVMDINYWNNVESRLGEKITSHQLEI